MTGKEIVDICSSHECCHGCELEYKPICEEVMKDMEDGTPAAIYEILEKEYGGDS